MTFTRYAIYTAPPAGDFASFAAGWLGWDPSVGEEVAHPATGLDLAAVTRTPRKYGFHGTIKPPFALAPGHDRAGLVTALDALAAGLAPVTLPGLELQRIGGFLALTPLGDLLALGALAATVVTALDPFRAAMTPEDRARRRPERLSPRQRELLDLWGYPWVMEEFKFHLTLSGDLDPETAAATEAVLRDLLPPLLPVPFVIQDLCLFGEAPDGRFHLLHRAPLG